MRRRRTSLRTQVGTESFVDVLANTLGGFALLSILAALDAGNLRWPLFISEEQPAETTAVRLVVAGDRVKPFDTETLAAAVAALPAGTHHLPANAAMPFEVTVTVRSGGEAELRFAATEHFAGEPVTELLAGRGEIAARLRRLDGRRSHVFLYLAPDSFHRYLDLRAAIRAAELQLGWAPLPEPFQLSYGRGGGMAEVIDVER